MTFGSPTANSQVNFTDSIDLTGGSRQIFVAQGTGGDSALISGDIVDSGRGASLLKTGQGTLILSGSNSYDGGTTVADGTLMVATASALPAGGSLAVGADGTFIFDPTAAAAPLAASPAGSVAPVPEPGTLALLLAGAMLAAFAAWRQRKN